MTNKFYDKELEYKDKLIEVDRLFPLDDWQIEEANGYKYYLNKEENLTEQGWKIHISCQVTEISKLLDQVLPILIDEGVSFKVLNTLEGIMKCNGVDGRLSQIGKIVTVYPNDTDHAYLLGKQLDAIWNQSSAPCPPSDLFYRPGGNVSLRYGAIKNTTMVTAEDQTQWPAITNLNGDLVADRPLLNGMQVEWAPPLPEQLSPSAYFKKEIEFLEKIENNRYQIMYPLSIKNFSLALICVDTVTYNVVLVKMHHKRSVADINGSTFLDKAKNNLQINFELSNIKLAPEILNTYEDDFFFYIIQEYIIGKTFSKISKNERIEKLPLLLKKLQQMHDLNIVHRDLKLDNVLVTDDDVYFIDFEISGKVGEKSLFNAGTEGYIPPEGVNTNIHPSYDSFSLGSCFLHAYVGTDPGGIPADRFQILKAYFPYIPTEISAIVKRLYSENAHERPAPIDCIPFIVPAQEDFNEISLDEKKQIPERINKLLNDCLYSITKSTFNEKNIANWNSRHVIDNSSHILGLNTGISGSLLGFLAIISTRKNYEEYFGVVDNTIQYIEAYGEKDLPAGLFLGYAGAALALGAAHHLYKKDHYLELSYDFLQKAISKNTDYDFFNGYAGIAYAAVRVFQSSGETRFLEMAEYCIDILLENKESAGGITAWRVSTKEEIPRYETGVAHGTAGIAYAIAVYAMQMKSSEHLDFATQCLKEIYEKGSIPDRDCIYQNLGERRDITSNITWCHGNAGYLWVMIQIPQAYKALEKEIEWALSICSATPTLGNPTYCHGMAGSLELWRLLNLSEFGNRTTERCFENAIHQLINIPQKIEALELFTSEKRDVISPSLWVGYTGTASSLALAKAGSTATILNTKW